MIMVRQWMMEQKLKGMRPALALIGSLLLSACNPTELSSKGARSNSIINSDGSLDGKAYVYEESPFILSDGKLGLSQVNIGNLVNRVPQSITPNNKLSANCKVRFNYYSPFFSTFLSTSDELVDCVRQLHLSTDTVPLSRLENRTFIFPTGSDEFYQASTLYHVQKVKTAFLDKLQNAYNFIHGASIDYRLPRSVPAYLRDSRAYWFKGVGDASLQTFRNSFLNSYSACSTTSPVAAFSPAGPSLCFGIDSNFKDFRSVQDPSVIYHEFGHAAVAIMMNLRNSTSSTSHPFRTNLLNLGYDEAAALNEGIADYFSYMVNKRTHFAEWLGKRSNQSRPLSEDDPKHIPVLGTTSEGRLAYPDYLHYDPNVPEAVEQSVHYAGSIVAHYLVAFTEELKGQCGLSSEADQGHAKATDYVLLLLAETLSELGDLEAKGVDNNYSGIPYANTSIFFNNLDRDSSYVWAQYVNPPTYRKFFQVWAKNIKKYVSNSVHGLCPNYDKNVAEKLLDDYGLLLFKTYNDNGNSTKSRSIFYENVADLNIHNGVPPTAVSEDNRRKSVLVSKTLIDLAPNVPDSSSAVNFYIIDNRTTIEDLLKRILYKGFLLPLTTTVSSVEYNNSNIRISPGEVVALIPNLYNSSNTPMAGVHLLANDWDHVHVTSTLTGNFKPCVVDEVTTVDQGAEAGNSCLTTDSTYRRLVPSAGVYPANAAAPVCLVEYNDGSSTRWVSQNEFRKKHAILDKECLGYQFSGTTETDFSFNPHECLARFLPGANRAFFSRIDPQKTFYQTVVEKSELKEFDQGNLLVMEVNKLIPVGTKFRCRMRVKFSNCSDCYTDGTNANDDFLDADFNGAKPYKVINFDFNVLD